MILQIYNNVISNLTFTIWYGTKYKKKIKIFTPLDKDLMCNASGSTIHFASEAEAV